MKRKGSFEDPPNDEGMLNFRCPSNLRRKIDRWGQASAFENRSAAIRRLVVLGLHSEMASERSSSAGPIGKAGFVFVLVFAMPITSETS